MQYSQSDAKCNTQRLQITIYPYQAHCSLPFKYAYFEFMVYGNCFGFC
ncbi:hypothetical protein T03_8039 [Trichinella britovi]|uniref:Uncharacterized protein n=1 Tax=Trichinella britovi TaxID=45882 RepID=A0A0V0YVB0_TRIBR|nr:hypothetical protein T03_8039 [Trichinella britovi]